MFIDSDLGLKQSRTAYVFEDAYDDYEDDDFDEETDDDFDDFDDFDDDG
ncbi:MAG TPA: hypothetical protein PLP41_09130 [Treponemataceae bacterium]|nr:hypothetical protein [Treponemataceae bacterium]